MDHLQPAQQTFFAESRDLLADMEQALLTLEHEPDDAEAINAVFRAAHTIKGSAGVFNFDDIVSFTHVMESLLVEIREGRLNIDAELIALLLECGDHVNTLLLQTTGGEHTMDAATRTSEAALIARLQVYLSEDAAYPVSSSAADDDYGFFFPSQDKPSSDVSSDTWHISLRFETDVLRYGMDPLSQIRYLETIGEVVNIATLFDSMPDAGNMDPESCYIGLEIDFRGAVDKRALDEAFDFVRDHCQIHILPPHSKISDYIELINELPESQEKLGEILVSSGALTQYELEAGLHVQQQLDGKHQQMPETAPPAPKLGEILIKQHVVQNELVDAALKKQALIKEDRMMETTFMRVRADKLDELIALVGELVIVGTGTRLQAHRFGNNVMIEYASTLERLVEQIRDGTLRLRMVPIGETFSRFNRVVRDLGRELNKQARLVISGADTELDKSMVDKIGDPLMHLVRNAMDHGMEPPEIRSERGKPETATLQLNAYHDSGSIVIEVIDDGGGMDREKIIAKALEKGLISPAQQLSDQEVYKLILEPGFSTAAEVTNVSGRGIGMDVVKRNVEALRGTIAIDSSAGIGTSIALRLPLTLAIIDGFVVKAGEASYVIPLDMVVECLELPETDRAAIATRGYINLREEVLPLLRLRDTFAIESELARRENIVVVKYAGMQVGLVVDALLGEFQTVIKPLGRLFERLGGISGSTILGSGEVALILDVPALVQKAAANESQQSSRPELLPHAGKPSLANSTNLKGEL